jgi:hypothetical protein
MKGLLISAAMFAAIGGTAFAQSSDTGSAAPADTTAAPAPASPTMSQPMDSSTAMPTAPAAAPAAPAATPAPEPAAPAAPMAEPDNATDTTAMVSPQGGAYPICKTRSQDHCRVASQTPRAKHHKMARAKTTAPEPAAATPNS